MKPLAILALSLALAACSVEPSAKLADGTIVTLGVSWLTRNTHQASYAKVTGRGGQVVELRNVVEGKDETKAVAAVLAGSLAGIAGGVKKAKEASTALTTQQAQKQSADLAAQKLAEQAAQNRAAESAAAAAAAKVP